MKHGVIREDGTIVPEAELPDFVQVGMHDPKARMFGKRYNLEQAEAGDPIRLVTETWREYVYRRNRCLEVRQKLLCGEVRDINDLITLNLDIRQFAQDVIETCEGPELLRAFWHAIETVTVLDPTCGSGAFLFAALNILEPLYEACLERMEAFVADLERSGMTHRPEKFADFRKVLERMVAHPNPRYFVFKSIILNNLYGVDIMEEAVEICKLRLFLKLAAQVEPDPSHPNLGIEPLPDIDFNIRAGNTLVGFATYDEVEKAVTAKLDFDKAMEHIQAKAADLQQAFDAFRIRQMEGDESVPLEHKLELRRCLTALNEELNHYLAKEYDIDPSNKDTYDKWLKSHQPFNWFMEFYNIVHDRGGFGVVIGNPPYVEYRKVRKEYSVQGFRTERCANLYAFVIERSLNLLREGGRCGVIVPIASVSTEGMRELQALYSGLPQWHSHFAVRPGKLFDGVDMNLTITMLQRVPKPGQVFVTGYRRWSGGWRTDRPVLFYTLTYTGYRRPDGHVNPLPKLGSPLEVQILRRILAHGHKLRYYVVPNGLTIYYHSGGRYWRKALPAKLSSHYKPITVAAKLGATVIALLNSQLFYWYWISNSNCMDVVAREVLDLPVFPLFEADTDTFASLTRRLLETYDTSNTKRRRRGERISIDEINFDVPRAKPIIDEIDQALAHHYGLTDEELDFIINYDIKYRMGRDAGEEQESE